jgi:type II secretory pathway component GspD/PulD (secretin)
MKLEAQIRQNVRMFAIGLLMLMGASASADQIVIKHVRPSKLLGSIMGSPTDSRIAVKLVEGENKGVLPPGITNISADDAASTLTIEGSPKSVEELKEIVSLFDIVPRRIAVRIIIQSPIDKYDSTTTTEINNNSQWRIRDDVTGIDLRMTPRINGDGTVTGSLDLDSDSRLTQVITRTKNKESIRLKVTDGPGVHLRNVGNDGYSPTDILITVTFTVLDDPKPVVKN